MEGSGTTKALRLEETKRRDDPEEGSIAAEHALPSLATHGIPEALFATGYLPLGEDPRPNHVYQNFQEEACGARLLPRSWSRYNPCIIQSADYEYITSQSSTFTVHRVARFVITPVAIAQHSRAKAVRTLVQDVHYQ